MASVATASWPASAVDLPPEEIIFGTSPAMSAIQRIVGKAANANIPVLLQGQSGTGKEILAKLIHRLSPWGNGPFVKVNCPAIAGTPLEEELFNHKEGALSGVSGTKPEQAEPAHRGTLFLDEIAELGHTLQAKLSQLLQRGHSCWVGARKENLIEARIVSATNRQLEHEIVSGTFRKDLFYRINVVTMQLPPLRERREDIPMLVSYFLATYSKAYNCPVRRLPKGLWEDFQRYQWPGNIRELENLIKRYVILGSTDKIHSDPIEIYQDQLNSDIPSDSKLPLREAVRRAGKQLERKMILRALEFHHWNRRLAARTLRISYTALLYKMREAGVLPGRSPRGQPEATVDSDRGTA